MTKEKTELAKTIIEDGQSIRSVWNYLSLTFDDIENLQLDDCKFTDRQDFYQHIKNTVDMMINADNEQLIDSK